MKNYDLSLVNGNLMACGLRRHFQYLFRIVYIVYITIYGPPVQSDINLSSV